MLREADELAMPLPQGPGTAPADTLPDPAQAATLGDLVERLRLLKIWAGDPSYEIIKDRINAAWSAAGRPRSELTRRSTVANCFQPGRRRMNTDLLLAVVEALHPDTGYVTQWGQAMRVITGEVAAVSQVRVQGSLPAELAGFTGRAGELDTLRRSARVGDAVVISAIKGMAGVGKTQLAVHAAHRLHREEPFDRVLFVNLRGFHPDPGQPPADPAAVLDGFLRLLGLPGHQIPHGLAARAAAYRDRLAGIRALVVLDNAATTEQVRPLLPGTPGCLTLITSRRSLAGLHPAGHLAVDVFTPGESVAFLTTAVPGVPVGADPDAAARIAGRCGHLPLALSLIAGHIRGTPGWTLTDHADRLDERHRDRRLDTAVELALDLSYRHLPAELRRLLRLVALHPGQDFDAHAAAALADADLPGTRARLAQLRADHLLQPATAGRFTLHDLVRAYATSRAADEDRPAERRAALTRLFDLYLATAAAAMDTLHPAEAHRRPRIAPAVTPAPDLTDPDAAIAWLDGERPTLVAVAGHTAAHGWPGHTPGLARTLSRYLAGGYHNDALAVHGHALQAARRTGDPAAQAHALTDMGHAHLRLGRHEQAAEHLRRALGLFRQTDDPVGQARALYNLGIVQLRAGRYPAAIDHLRQSLAQSRLGGDHTGESNTLTSLGVLLERSGRVPEAVESLQQALTLARRTGYRQGEAMARTGLGELEVRAGRYERAGEHLRYALELHRHLGNRGGEAGVLDSLGLLHTRRGRPDLATEHYREALAIYRAAGDQNTEAWVLNGLGAAAHAAGRAADAVAHHTAALAIAVAIGGLDLQARAQTGLGEAQQALGDAATAREHYRRAVALYTELGLPEADLVRARLAELDGGAP